MNIKYKKNATNSGIGFDSFLNLDKLRSLYLTLNSGMDCEISMKDNFNHSEMYLFINSILNIKKDSILYTDNIHIFKIIQNIENKPPRKIFVIDNHNFFHRMFHSTPAMINERGDNIAVLKSLSNFLKWFISTQSNSYSHIIFTSEGKFLHRKKFTEDSEFPYKGNRSPTSNELKDQIRMSENFLKECGFLVLSKDGYEADDMLASITRAADKVSIPVTAFTSDKDAYQLADIESFEIMDPKSKISERASLSIINKFGIRPNQFVDYQGIVGDTADNVTGIKGYGKDTAKKILLHYGSMDNLFNNISNFGLEEFNLEEDKIPKAKLTSALKKQQKLLDNKDIFLKSRDLCRLRDYLITDINDYLDKSRIPEDNQISIIKQVLSTYGIVY